jgi:UDP-N-acetylglucosamine 4-epimerase
LHGILRDLIAERCPTRSFPPPVHAAFRAGDVRHSEADIGKARRLLGYLPQFDVRRVLREALPWYEQHLRIEATAKP